MRRMDAEFRGHSRKHHSPFEGGPILVVDVARRAKAIRTQHQVSCGKPFVNAEVGAIFERGRFKAGESLFETFSSTAVPEVPPFSDKILGFRYVEPISDFGSMCDPGTKLVKDLLHLSDCNVDR